MTDKTSADLFYPDLEETPLQPISEDNLEESEEVEPVEAEEETESEAEEVEEEEESESEETEEEYLELDGEDVSLEDVRKWRELSATAENERMMLSTYQKKTSELAETKKQVESLRDELQVLVDEDNDIDWKELREDDPEKFIELKEKADARKKKLEEVKSSQPQLSQEELTQEKQKLFGAFPEWMNDKGETTEAYKNDMEVATKYIQETGYTQEEVAAITQSKHWVTIIHAAKFKANQARKSPLKKEVKKKLKATKKPPSKINQNPKTAEELFYGSN